MMTHIIWREEKLVPRFSIWNDYPIICLLFVFPIFLIDSLPIAIYIFDMFCFLIYIYA
jgi:hypothetical protein